MRNHNVRRRNKKTYINCASCNIQIPNKNKRQCNKCYNNYISDRRIDRNNNDGDNELERLRNYIQIVTNEYNNGINKRNNKMMNQGYVDSTKHEDCVRFLLVNPRGFGPDTVDKMETMIASTKKYEIDGLLLSAPDRKWNVHKIDYIKRKFKTINREVEVIISDSGQDVRSRNGYLPGGTINILLGRVAGLRIKQYEKKDGMGRWSSFRLEGNGKVLQFITIYRIPESTAPGILKSRAQYDRCCGEVKTSRQYRDQLLDDIAEEIKIAKADDVNDFVIAGDFNQDIAGDQMQRFMRENGLFEVHHTVNNIDNDERDNTHVTGSKQIDAVLATDGIVQSIKGSLLVEVNEIIENDHRGFIFDIDIQEYFSINASKYDRYDHVTIDPSRRSHRVKFQLKLDEYIEQLNLVDIVKQKCNQYVTGQELERIDQMITFVLDAARKHVEGYKRGLPFSLRKIQLAAAKQYYERSIKLRNGRNIDKIALEKKRVLAKIEPEELTMEQLKQHLEEATREWEEFKTNAQTEREQELLDFYPEEIVGDSEEKIKLRKKAIKNIKKAKYRQQTFNFLTKHVGKGEKNSLKRVKVVNEQNEIIKECQDRHDIETEIARYNKQHFRQAFSSKAYTDKIYSKLQYDNIRDKILNGTIERSECDHQDVFDFIQLMKKQGDFEVNSNRMTNITEDEWMKTVKKAKKRSASSVFSKRTYSVYKCALGSQYMTEILITFYNAVFRKGHYLERWIKLLAVILEKGKGPIIGKLRTLQLIEGDLQILMRIFIGGRNDENLDSDSRLSTFNYGSRKNYSIETALLEKRLMYDLAVRDGKPMMHTVSDLKACYDRQLPNLGCMVQESVGIEREPAKLFAKLLPVMQHHICTSFGISKQYYGSESYKLGGTGQGNSVSGAICRDTSCLIFRYLENKKLGVVVTFPISRGSFIRIAIAFVDDTDFYTNDFRCIQIMQEAMNIYTRLYEATGGKVQQIKILYYSWIWEYVDGRKYIKDVTANLVVNEEIIRQESVENSTRTLGVYVTPSLSWKTQFEVMKKKLHVSITKLMNTDINPYQAAIYYNIYMIKSVYFGCGIIELSAKQEQALQQIYEEPLLVKLGLSRNFPRLVLYSRKSALGVGIMRPSTIIDMLKAKQYLGHKRMNSIANQSIQLQEEYLKVESGRDTNLLYDPSERYWKKLWIDEVNDMFYRRKIELHRNKNEGITITNNVTVMDLAVKYAELKGYGERELTAINYVRLKKKLYLPFELVGTEGRAQTECYLNIDSSSQIMWGFLEGIQGNITRYQKRIWEEFIRWISYQNVRTVMDIKPDKWCWMISDCEDYVKMTGNDKNMNVQWLKRKSRGTNEYEIDENGPIKSNIELTGIIGRIERRGRLIICGREESEIEQLANDNQTDNSQHFPEDVEEAIRKGTALAAVDASIDENYMAAWWIITDVEENFKETGQISSSKWGSGQTPVAEGVGVLNLIAEIRRRTGHMSTGSIVVFSDMRMIVNEVNKERVKDSQCVREAGATINGIKQEIEKATITIRLEYSSTKTRNGDEFEDNPGPYLLRECDANSKRIRSELGEEEQESIIHVADTTPICEGVLSDKSISVLIREVDARASEREYAETKNPEYFTWLDLEARNVFHDGTGAGTLKCVVGFNHYGERDMTINSGLTDSKCPRCQSREDWEHVILCSAIQEQKEKYIQTLKSKIAKVKNIQHLEEPISWIVGDIEQYLKGEETNEYNTTQGIVGMKMLFRGWVTKNWVNPNETQPKKMHTINKIIVKSSVMFYSEAWRHRNEMKHKPEAYKEFVKLWYSNVREMIERDNRPEVLRYARMQELDLDRCDSAYIVMWIKTILKMRKKAKKVVLQDIRQFLM